MSNCLGVYQFITFSVDASPANVLPYAVKSEGP